MKTEATKRSDVFLEQSSPPSSRMWPLTSERVTIGRDASSDVFVDDPGISRHHADLVRRGLSWSIIDDASTNGTYVNGARVRDSLLQPGDRIRIGNTELVLREAGSDSTDRHGYAPRFDVESQAGNISNVAGNQSNYYQRESNLRYIATRRGHARALIVWGIVVFFIGMGFPLFFVSDFFSRLAGASGPAQAGIAFEKWMQLIAVSGLITLLGLALFIFGLIARSGAKREARRLGADWR